MSGIKNHGDPMIPSKYMVKVEGIRWAGGTHTWVYHSMMRGKSGSGTVNATRSRETPQ